jgi:hypothetical protein
MPRDRTRSSLHSGIEFGQSRTCEGSSGGGRGGRKRGVSSIFCTVYKFFPGCGQKSEGEEIFQGLERF